MRLVNQRLRLSATDLANHLGCAHLSRLSLAAAHGRASKPRWQDPVARILRERGEAHEAAYLDHLRSTQGIEVVHISQDEGHKGQEATVEAMRGGAPLIYQAPLGDGAWFGRADFLKRVQTPSDLGGWSYEVIDAKLATETRAGTVLQLCVYSELVRDIQGGWPEHAWVVAPHHGFQPERHRLADYAAYYRLVKRRLEESVGEESGATYPEPVPHCEVCDWWPRCDARRRADDHLCFVAGISRLQINELKRRRVDTLERLGELDEVPAPARGSRDALARVRDQAAIQLEARRRNTPRWELLHPLDATHGLALLPEPSAHDVFLDLEGDRLAAEGGRDYLFGWAATGGDYTPLWALDPASEKRAFEEMVDRILAAFRDHPDMHVYHFGAYEVSAFKRLAGRYATRQSELDVLLRAELFVDLFRVVRHALIAGVESYSIKELERFYGYERAQDMREATAGRRAVEWAIETRQASRDAADLAPHFEAVERYNREDCVSAEKLRDWLETLRAAAVRDGAELPRPELKTGEAGESVQETEGETHRVMAALLAGVADDPDSRDEAEQARWLMAHLLEWHRREDKAAWWEYFRLRDLALEDYEGERSALAGLAHREHAGGTPTRPVHRYAFPAQEHDIRRGDDVCLPDGAPMGKVVQLDHRARTVDIQHGGKWADARPVNVFVRRVVPPGDKPAALLELGRWLADHDLDGPGPARAARDLLLRRPPRLEAGAGGPETVGADDDELAAACRLAAALDEGVLPIQGPPGTGKTYTGAHMIVRLVAAGRRVGVTAVSHDVIRNLLSTCIDIAAERGAAGFKCLHKGRAGADQPEALHAVDSYDRILSLFGGDGYRVLGGTAWLWSREEFRDSVDVLFIDEAGQMSLADVLAVARGGRRLVMLGDPQQLEQPQQASHPPGTEASALEHLLGGRRTIPAEAGLFLRRTRRLHPRICAFTAEVFYEGRLQPFPGLEHQAVLNAAPLPENGLAYLPVAHEGNQSRSDEEVEAVAGLVDKLTGGKVAWRDADGLEKPLTREDIMLVAPYNAQVAALSAALPSVRTGTVDRFQGQQAPVVIISLATSAPEDAPRGMSFLYSANRLNVATSRARGLCILVGSPALFEPECRTPDQMRLANAFCAYVELAHIVA